MDPLSLSRLKRFEQRAHIGEPEESTSAADVSLPAPSRTIAAPPQTHTGAHDEHEIVSGVMGHRCSKPIFRQRMLPLTERRRVRKSEQQLFGPIAWRREEGKQRGGISDIALHGTAHRRGRGERFHGDCQLQREWLPAPHSNPP